MAISPEPTKTLRDELDRLYAPKWLEAYVDRQEWPQGRSFYTVACELYVFYRGLRTRLATSEHSSLSPEPQTTPKLHWKLPLSRDEFGTYIFDADRTMIAQIRGWGHLTGTGGLHLSDDEAVAVQKARLDAIVRAVNLHDELYEALTSLANEAAGVLGRGLLDDVIGTTNARCLQRRVDEARALLAKVEGR